jgi:bacillopeptidase F (M6 metalloprotease family)
MPRERFVVRYNIELDWDYAYLKANGTPVPTNLSKTADPNGQNFGYGPPGVSVSSGWVDLTADLSAFAGRRSGSGSGTGPTPRPGDSASWWTS